MIHEKEAFIEGVNKQLEEMGISGEQKEELSKLTLQETKQASRTLVPGLPEGTDKEASTGAEETTPLMVYLLKQADLEKEAVIKKEGDEWVLYDSEGEKVLGRHDTKEEAKEQERAIQANKHAFLQKNAKDGEGNQPGFSLGDIDWDEVGRGALAGAPLGAGGGLLYSLLTGGNPLAYTLGGAGLGGLAGAGVGGTQTGQQLIQRMQELFGGQEGQEGKMRPIPPATPPSRSGGQNYPLT